MALITYGDQGRNQILQKGKLRVICELTHDVPFIMPSSQTSQVDVTSQAEGDLSQVDQLADTQCTQDSVPDSIPWKDIDTQASQDEVPRTQPHPDIESGVAQKKQFRLMLNQKAHQGL